MRSNPTPTPPPPASGPTEVAGEPAAEESRSKLGQAWDKIDKQQRKRLRIDRPVLVILTAFFIMVAWHFVLAPLLVTEDLAPPDVPPAEKPVEPAPWNAIVFGSLTELDDGRLKIAYDLDPDENVQAGRARSQQYRDWRPGRGRIVLSRGAIANEATGAIRFDGDVRVAFEAIIERETKRTMKVAVIEARLCMATTADYYAFSVNFLGRATVRRQTPDGYKLLAEGKVGETLEVGRTYRFDFAYAEGRLVGKLDGKLLCEADVPDEFRLTTGPVGMRARSSLVLFDNIVITGTPAAEWIRQRSIVYQLEKELREQAQERKARGKTGK